MQFLTDCAVFDRLCSFWQTVQFLTDCAVYDRLCSFWQTVQFLTDCAVYDRLCSFWQTVQFMTDCAVFDRLCSLWQTVQFMTDCAVFDRLCSFWQTVQFFWQTVQFMTDCAVFDRLCSLWQTVQFMTDCANFDRLCSLWQTVQFMTDCAVFDRLCSFWQTVQFMTDCAEFMTDCAVYDRLCRQMEGHNNTASGLCCPCCSVCEATFNSNINTLCVHQLCLSLGAIKIMKESPTLFINMWLEIYWVIIILRITSFFILVARSYKKTWTQWWLVLYIWHEWFLFVSNRNGDDFFYLFTVYLFAAIKAFWMGLVMEIIVVCLAVHTLDMMITVVNNNIVSIQLLNCWPLGRMGTVS